MEGGKGVTCVKHIIFCKWVLVSETVLESVLFWYQMIAVLLVFWGTSQLEKKKDLFIYLYVCMHEFGCRMSIGAHRGQNTCSQGIGYLRIVFWATWYDLGDGTLVLHKSTKCPQLPIHILLGRKRGMLDFMHQNWKQWNECWAPVFPSSLVCIAWSICHQNCSITQVEPKHC